jgi:hypothetical protein
MFNRQFKCGFRNCIFQTSHVDYDSRWTFAHQWYGHTCALLRMFLISYRWYGQNAPAVLSPHPLKIGILSSAMINAAAIIRPAQTHGEVVLSAIASRDLQTAHSQAKKYNIAHAFGTYEELLDSPHVDFVYISLPNGMHGEWAIKAMEKGKHVLLEKPFTANAAEAKRVVDTAKRTGMVLMEVSVCYQANVTHSEVLAGFSLAVSPCCSRVQGDLVQGGHI